VLTFCLRRFYETLTHDDSVQPVDTIVVMAGRMERKHYAVELYRAGLAPRLILSVGRFEVSKMDWLDLDCVEELKSLRDATSPAERHFFVVIDVSGMRVTKGNLQLWSTYGEVLAYRRLLTLDDIRRVMVVSTDVHLCRVAMTFGIVFRESPIQFSFCAVPPEVNLMSRDNWWKHSASRLFVVRELVKLCGYWISLSAPEWARIRLMRLTGWNRK
jgi:hypothetical protein